MSVTRDYQYLLAHNRFGSFHPGKADGVWGPTSKAAVRRAKYALGYRTKDINDRMGVLLYKRLLGPKRHGIRLTPAMLLRRKARQVRRPNTRAKIVAYCRRGVANTWSIHYAQTRPYPSNPLQLPMTTDCSGFATLAYKYAGAPDPNGLGYNGQGWTGTLLEHGRTIHQWEAKPGDLVVYGAAPGHHVAVMVEADFDPLLVSHGQEGDPRYIRHSLEAHGQAANGHSTVTWKRYIP